MRGALAIAFSLLLGCNQGPVVQLRLVPSSSLDVATNVVDLRIGFFLPNQALPEVDLAPSPGALDSMSDLATTDGLAVGERYEVRVTGTSEPCARSDDRVVGRSLPFTHTAEAYEVSLQVGCAEEFQFTRRQPLARRIGHALVALPDGGAVVAGGGGALTDDEFGVTMPSPAVADVELYDPTLGAFRALPDNRVAQGRVNPGARLLDSGEVVLAGGSSAAGCLTSTEIVYPTRRAGAPLGVPHCAPDLVPLGDDEVVVTAGVTDPVYEVVPATFAEGGRSFAGGLPRVEPRVAAWEHDILVLGGRETGEITPSIEHVRLDCPGAPCVGPVVPDIELPLGLGLTSMIGLECPTGGGTAYVTGGIAVQLDATGATCPMNDRAACCAGPVCDETEAGRVCVPNVVADGVGLCGSYGARQEVYCFSTADPRFSLVGALRVGVYGHETVAVGEVAERRRLLLIGGIREDFAGVGQAQPVVADACTCAPLEDVAEPLPMPAGVTVFDHAVTTLADGSILVTGGIDTDQLGVPGVLPRTADFYSVIFFPDLP